MKQVIVVIVLLTSLLAFAAHAQTVRVGASGAPRVTAAGDIRSTPTPLAGRTILVPGYGIYEDDGAEKVYVIPGYGIYAGAP